MRTWENMLPNKENRDWVLKVRQGKRGRWRWFIYDGHTLVAMSGIRGFCSETNCRNRGRKFMPLRHLARWRALKLAIFGIDKEGN